MICRDITKLKEPFRSLIYCLLVDIEEKGLQFEVFETLRSLDRQKMLKRSGRSRTLQSKHLEGLACDIVYRPMGKWNWSDEKAYNKLGELVAKYPELEWGGSWKKFPDLAHVQYNAG